MKFLLYLECLIFFTIFVLLVKLTSALGYIGKSCDWYSERGLHPWQVRKARQLYAEEFERSLKDAARSKGKDAL